MSSDAPWTIDTIAHALPHPELRATFMREVTFTDVSRLPAILDRWQRRVEQIEAGRPEAERVRDHFQEHGTLPPDYAEESPESRAAFDDWKRRMEAIREGRNVA